MKRVISLILFITISICNTVVAQDKNRSSSIVNIGGESFYVHTVAKGETLFSIAKLYDTTEEEVVKINPSSAGVLSIDMVIKIPYEIPEYTRREIRKRDKKFIKHTVIKGETAYSIAKQYGIPVNLLVEDNPTVEIIALPLNHELNIRKEGIGESDQTEIKENLVEYADNLNSVSDEYVYHVVKKEDTFYKLSKQYEISIDEIKSSNSIIDNNLRLGEIIKVGKIEGIKDDSNLDINKELQKIDTIKLGSLFPINSNDVIVANLSQENCVNIAMFLPILGSKQDVNFLEFYQGALLAIKKLKEKGISVNLNLFNSFKSPEKVRDVIVSGGLDYTDLIIGPIYENSAAPVIEFAQSKKVPVISPLATFNNISSSALFQLAPTDRSKYDKLSTYLLGDKNIIVIKSALNDTVFENEIRPSLPQNFTTLQYSKSKLTADINTALSPDKDNIFIILSTNPYRIDEILARISSVQNNRRARSIKLGNISTIGTSKWTKFANIDRNLFFKLNVKFISSYYADKNNNLVSTFDKNYIKEFRSIPGQYAYRAYDAVILFGNAVAAKQGDVVQNSVNDPEIELLQMHYIFEKDSHSESISNTNWGLVKYNSDYTITVE